MDKEFFLPVPLYLQVDCHNDTNEMCGAACAQMVLHDINPQRPFTKGEQKDLYDQINARATEGGGAWYSPPQGIKRILNVQKPARLPGRDYASLKADIQAIFDPVPPNHAMPPYEFVIFGDSSPETNPNPGVPRAIIPRDQIAQIELLSRQLIRTVALRGVAPIVAVREDNAHWIIVNGFLVEEDYRDAGLDQRGKIKAIYIRNPLGRYTYRTINCGSLPGSELQVITGHHCNLNPYVQDVVPYATWVREYMFSDWAETFVEVCDWSAQVADDVLSRIHCLASRNCGESAVSAICNWIARVCRAFCRLFPKRQITADDAVDRDKRAIEDFKLSQINERVTPEKTFKPVKVKRLDRIDGDYYLVHVGVEKENKVSALINISITGEFDGAAVWPINTPRKFDKPCDRSKDQYTEPVEQDPEIDEFYEAIARPNEHYTAPFERHPNFGDLTSDQKNSLIGRKIQPTDGGDPLTITNVRRDETTPYVWRPGPESFSPFRPFHNLKLTVQGAAAPISFYLPVDDYCLPGVENDEPIPLPSANYLEILTDCIKQKAGSMVDQVLVKISRSGTTAMVMYKSNQTMSIDQELERMKKNVCECLNAHPSAGLSYYRIKAFATDAFLTALSGGGEDGPLETVPHSGGGDNGIPIQPCPPVP